MFYVKIFKKSGKIWLQLWYNTDLRDEKEIKYISDGMVISIIDQWIS